MKKNILVLALLSLALISCKGEVDLSNIKTGYANVAPHGYYTFGTVTVVMADDVIIAANIDEFQFQAEGGNYVGVPNSDRSIENSFGTNVVEGKLLMSKKLNSDAYSAVMATKAGSTVKIADNYGAIENFAKGKTIAELETVAAKDATAVVDAISGATLADSKGYLSAIIEAAKLAK